MLSGSEMEIIPQSVSAMARDFNEATVRAGVIDPIVKALGYSIGGDAYVILEEKLEYPYAYIGRRSKRDVPLGKVDYRAGLKGARGSFVIEAKAGSVIISDIDVEQAHSYAAHAQVGANYFVLCNGVEIRVYETLSGPKAVPIVTMPVSDVNVRFHEIENILSPSVLEKNCSKRYDTGLRLCDGIGSSLRVRSGVYSMADYTYRILVNEIDQTALFRANAPGFGEVDRDLELFRTSFQMRVDGSMGRGGDGRIGAVAKFSGVTHQNQEGIRIMGIEEISLVTDSKFLSISSSSPTMFESVSAFGVERGAVIPKLFGGGSQMLSDVSGGLFVKLAMHLDGRRLKGEYIALANYYTSYPFVGKVRGELDIWGEFDMEIDA